MKKKFLISLTAMLTVAGLAFAVIPDGWTPAKFWHEHGANLLTDQATLTKESINAEKYAAIKASCAAMDALNEDQKVALIGEWTPQDGDPAFKAGVMFSYSSLATKNSTVANEKVTDICSVYDAYVPSAAKESDLASVLPAMEVDVDSWKDVEDDFATYKTNRAGYNTKIKQAYNYAYVDKFNTAAQTLIDSEDATLKAVTDLINDFNNGEGEYLFKETDDLATIKGGADAKMTALLAKKNALENARHLANLTEVVPDMMKKLGIYTFGDEDLEDDVAETRDYAKLTDIKNSLYVLVNLNKADGDPVMSDDNVSSYDKTKIAIPTAVSGKNVNAAFVEAAIEMAEEQIKMEAARNYLRDVNNLYAQAKRGEAAEVSYSDYENIYVVKTTSLVAQNDYVKSLYTPEMANVIYDKAVTALKAHMVTEKATAVKTDFTDTYATVLAEKYVVVKEDYDVDTDDDNQTVREAINAYKALYTGTTTSWSEETTFISSKAESWTITDAEKIEIGLQAQNSLAAEYATLQARVRSAAVLKLQATLQSEANAIFSVYVDPTAEEYNAAAVLKLKDDLTAIKAAATNLTNLGTSKAAGTKMQYYYWDAANDAYVENTSTKTAGYIAAEGADKTFGNTEVVVAYKGSSKAPKSQYYTRKDQLTAMQAAAQFLSDKADLIWTGEPEALNTTGVGIVGLEELATTTMSKTTGSYNKLSAAAKTYIPMNDPVGGATVGSAEQVYDVLAANCAVAMGEALPDAGITSIELVYGNKAKATTATAAELAGIESIDDINTWIAGKLDAVTNENQKTNYLVYVNAELDPALMADNVVVKNGGAWKANKVNFVNGYPYYVKTTITNVTEITFTKTFRTTKHQAIYVPFAIEGEDLDALIDGGFNVRYFNNVTENETEDAEGNPVTEVSVCYKNKKTGDKLWANKPYIVNAPEAKLYVITAHNTAIEACGTKDLQGSVQATAVSAKYTLTGVNQDTPITSGGNKYRLVSSGKNAGFWAKANIDVYANDAILTIDATIPANYVIKHLNIDDDEEATGIENVSSEDKTLEGIYTINGQKVNNMNKPGLYIVNGKKVLVK